MARYTVVVKRGDFQYSVSGENKKFITSHIHMLFDELKTRVPKDFDVVSSQLDVEKPKDVEKTHEPQSYEQPCKEPEAEPIAEKEPEAVLEEKSEGETAEKENTDTQFEDNQDKTNTQDLVQPDKTIEAQSNQDTSENVSENTQEYNESEPEKTFDDAQSQILPQSENNAAQFVDFENILEEKIKNPSTVEEVVYQEKPIDYESIVKSKSPETLTDYLIITAYFMLENEGIERFALKQLNQKLFSSMKLLVDNKTAQKALEEGFIEVVSDFKKTGVTEYSLTQQGRDYYLNGFK